jgi:hypothetical protein
MNPADAPKVFVIGGDAAVRPSRLCSSSGILCPQSKSTADKS